MDSLFDLSPWISHLAICFLKLQALKMVPLKQSFGRTRENPKPWFCVSSSNLNTHLYFIRATRNDTIISWPRFPNIFFNQTLGVVLVIIIWLTLWTLGWNGMFKYFSQYYTIDLTVMVGKCHEVWTYCWHYPIGLQNQPIILSNGHHMPAWHRKFNTEV